MAQERPVGGMLLPPEPLIYPTEFFKLLGKQHDRELRKRMLVEYYKKDEKHARVLRSIAELIWHPSIIWELPEGPPPYTKASMHEGQNPTSLFKVIKEVSRFLKGGGNFIQNPLKREHYFIQILESISVPEAELLIAIKDKTVSDIYPYVRLDIFAETFPQWFPEAVVRSAEPFLEKVEIPEPPPPPETGNYSDASKRLQDDYYAEVVVNSETSEVRLEPILVRKNKGGRPRKNPNANV